MMEAPSFDMPAPETSIHDLHIALDALPEPVFAVLDGGHFDALEESLSGAGISSRSLFLDGAGDDIRRDGPWLVGWNDQSSDQGKRDHIAALAFEKPCAVFWSCIEGEETLWRHLRTINKVLVPDERFPDRDGGSGKPVEYEQVLFRHWDPDVLASVLPMLDVHQIARLFGPAQALLMNAPDHGGLVRASRPANLPRMPNGLLTIHRDQLAALDAGRRDAYCRRMSVNLRAMAPQETAGMSEKELNERLLRYERSGNALGLTQERSLSVWGFLMIASGERFEQQREIRDFLRSGPGTPDENVETLLDQMTRLAGTVEGVD